MYYILPSSIIFVGGDYLIALETSGKLFGLDYRLLEFSFIFINIIFFIVFFIVPLIVVIFLVRKLFKYLDAKTKYYQSQTNYKDRQE